MAGLEAAFERIGASAEHHLEVSHSAGLALAVTDREEVLGVVCRGLADVAAGTPVRPETRFHIGSISKSFAAMIVLQEVAAGRLDLHVSVNEILPWLELPEPFGPITMHDLMTHTAGLLVGTEDAPTGPGALHRLKTNPATTKPGERWLYSNDGWKVVGACLEEVTGEPVHELLRTRVLGPARDARLGRRDRRRHVPGRRGRLRAAVHRPAGAAATPARAGAPDRSATRPTARSSPTCST